MRRPATVALLTAAALVAGCQRTETLPARGIRKTTTTTVAGPPTDGRNLRVDAKLPIDFHVLDRSALGSVLGGDGGVMTSKDTFKPGDPIYVSMWLHEKPVGLQTSVELTDAKGKVLTRELKPVKNEKVVTYEIDSRSLAPGTYHAIGYWGGNDVCDYTFTIEGAGKKKG